MIRTLLDVTSERRQRVLDRTAVRDDATYYTIDDGEQYIYVLKHTLRRDATELAVTPNAPIQFGLMYEEIGEDTRMTDIYGEAHILSLYKRYPRTARSRDDDDQTEAARRKSSP